MHDAHILIKIFCILVTPSTEIYHFHILRSILLLSKYINIKKDFQELICGEKKQHSHVWKSHPYKTQTKAANPPTQKQKSNQFDWFDQTSSLL